MRSVPFLLLVLVVFTLRLPAAWIDDWRARNTVWRGAHLLIRNAGTIHDLETALPALTNAGVNALVVEINYNLAFDRHPEVRAPAVITKAEARHFTDACRAVGVRLIPQFSCLGHQSWAGTTFPLLTQHPEFDETRDQFPGNKGIYCRSWCPRAEGLNAFVHDLLDEMIDAFDADALHVGLDEVFLIGSDQCPRCKGSDPAKLFADVVNDLHAHVVGTRHREMLMWADRLLDSKTTGFGEWEAAKNGTAGAIDLISKDIIQCDWHYEPLAAYGGKPTEYGSLKILTGKGFRVWPSSWKNATSARAFMEEARALKSPLVLGPLVTTWGAAKPPTLAEWEPLRTAFEVWK